MVSTWKTIVALSWKCQILRKRNTFSSIIELVLPILFCFGFYSTMRTLQFSRKRTVIQTHPVHSLYDIPITAAHISYTPKNNFTEIIMRYVMESLHNGTTIEAKETEEDISFWLQNMTMNISGIYNNTISVGIVFLETNIVHKIFKYKLRVNYRGMITNVNKVTELSDPLAYNENMYVLSSFLGVQSQIDKQILKYVGAFEPYSSGVNIGQLPTTKEQIKIENIDTFYLFGLIFAYYSLFLSIMSNVIDEKVSGMRELVKIMGVSSWMFWIHWILYAMIIQFPVIIISTFIVTGLEPNVVKGNSVIVLLLYSAFTINLIFMAFVLTCLFNNVNWALTCGIIIYSAIQSVVGLIIVKVPQNIAFTVQLISCVLPAINLWLAIDTLHSFTANNIKWKLQHLFTKGFSLSQISVGLSLSIFIISIVILMILLHELDSLYPGPYGVAKTTIFGLTFNWRSRNKYSEPSIKIEQGDNFEAPRSGAEVGISLRDLHKEFGSSKKVIAVNRINLDIYRGDITALLGPNGAGKTTTMSMIVGMTKPTSGTVMFDGCDITSKESKFRESLGLCPQNNMYFSKLTVIEHLIFFGMLKGLSFHQARIKGTQLLVTLDLLEKKDTIGINLSGGMKRKLCFAIALVGNPTFLILDEPTSGLDAQMRRKLWNLILSMRGERTILLTTHIMEEADVLGDRIAIMVRGNIACCGTSMFLKKLYGTGYHIHILKKEHVSEKPIINLVNKFVSSSSLKILSETHIEFIVSKDSAESFPKLFSSLEENKDNLQISGISLTCTTVDDVFLRVTVESTSEKGANNKTLSDNIPKFYKNDKILGLKLNLQRLEALFFKKFILYKRRWLNITGKTIMIIIIMSFIAYRAFPIKNDVQEKQIALAMNLNLYTEGNIYMLFSADSIKLADITKYIITSEGDKIAIKEIPNNTQIDMFFKSLITHSYEYYKQNTLLAFSFKNSNITCQYLSVINMHSPSIAVNLVSNILLRISKTSNYGRIDVINHPFTVYQPENCQLLTHISLAKILYLTFFIVDMILFWMNDIIHLITEEKVSGFKFQQYMTGTSPLLFWTVNIIFDTLLYSITGAIYFIIIMLFGPNEIFFHEKWTIFISIIIILIGINCLLFTYGFTHLFNRETTSSSLYIIICTVIGILPAELLCFLDSTDNLQFKWYIIFVILFSWNPFFLAVNCIFIIIKTLVKCKNCSENCDAEYKSLFEMPAHKETDVMLINLLFLALNLTLWGIIVLMVDYGIFRKVALSIIHKDARFKYSKYKDNDVITEIERVKTYKENEVSCPLRVEGIEKKYMLGPKAVFGVSFIVESGECFGLLGANGAGKTTTFKILTTEIIPNRGSAFINSFSLINDRNDYISSFGYCPQVDAVIETLTLEETLMILAKMQGVPRNNVRHEVRIWLEKLDILEHGKKKFKECSGGTKRKLSTVMAFIGSPDVVFLDEPTTGVDPVSRRKIWSVIQESQSQGQAVVLTSHSMEECEFLCSRLTIMVKGQMKCIGEVEYLKAKFGRSYTIHIKLRDFSSQSVRELKLAFDRVFPENEIKDSHTTFIHYRIFNPTIPLSRVFSEMLQIKDEHHIVEDFTASNITLEELFLSFSEDDV